MSYNRALDQGDMLECILPENLHYFVFFGDNFGRIFLSIKPPILWNVWC